MKRICGDVRLCSILVALALLKFASSDCLGERAPALEDGMSKDIVFESAYAAGMQMRSERFGSFGDGKVGGYPMVQQPVDDDDDDDDDDLECSITSSVNGSPLTDKLDVLREFRNRRLLTNVPGRWLTHAYYKMSPPIAGFLREHESARRATRPAVAGLIWLCESFG